MQSFLIVQAILLALAISADALLAAFSYGSQKISIPLRSLLLIAFLCTLVLGLSLSVGELLSAHLNPSITQFFSFAILFSLGLLRIFDGFVKHLIKGLPSSGREIQFSLLRLKFILQVYADPESADVDASRTLSLGEASFLAIALSLDGIAAGLGAGLMGLPIFLTISLTFLFTLGAIATGFVLGKRLSSKVPIDLSWLSGGLLILLAILQL